MGELINLNPLTITESQIPAAIARDTETAAAIAAHKAEADPHPNLWARITNAFVALTGGQQILKNNPAVSAGSFLAPANHIELATDNGSNPIIGFHRGGLSATSLYHSGYGDNSLRFRNADGFDSALLHDGNVGARCAVLNATLPTTASANGTLSLGSIAPNKVVGLTAIATSAQGGGQFIYITPTWGLGSSAGYRYGLYLSNNFIVMQTLVFAESQYILGLPIKILVHYLP